MLYSKIKMAPRDQDLRRKVRKLVLGPLVLSKSQLEGMLVRARAF